MMIKGYMLLLILLLAFYMAFIPHIGYAYPLHGDEWMHMAYTETIVQTGSITFPDPFTGQGEVGVGSNLWVGFHIFWAMYQQVSGIPWVELFRYFPAIIFMFTVLAVYILASREGYGLEAAFFTCLIPTTGGLLGPAFMVPMALGLLFIPLSLFLAFHIKNWVSYLLIFLFTCFLLLSHATTAIILCIILLPYALISIKDNTRHSIGIIAALLLPFVLPFPWIFKLLVQNAGQLLTPQFMSQYIEIPALLGKYGLVPVILSFLGTVLLITKGGKKNFGLILGLALLLIVMLVFLVFHYGLAGIYDRGLTTMLLILSIFAGAGLFWIRNLGLPAEFMQKHKSKLFRYAGNIACVILGLLILAIAVPTRFSAVFYHMVDDEDYRAFTWIKDNIGAEYTTALVDPWKATAFVAITGKKVLHRIWVNQEPVDDRIYSYLKSGCQDSAFLRDNRLSFVYNQWPCDNRDLSEVSDRVFVTNPNISTTFAQESELQNAGFEAVYGNPPTHWGKWSQNCKPAFLYPEQGRIGESSVAIRMMELESSTPTPQAIWLQNIPVQPGKSYTVGGWIKTENVEGQSGAMIVPNWKGPGNTWISATEFMPYLKGTNSWTYYQGNVTAPQGAAICTVCCLVSGCAGTAWYDDIEFKEK
jgi:hypothetical protein